jgi:hypothetical protein
LLDPASPARTLEEQMSAARIVDGEMIRKAFDFIFFPPQY